MINASTDGRMLRCLSQSLMQGMNHEMWVTEESAVQVQFRPATRWRPAIHLNVACWLRAASSLMTFSRSVSSVHGLGSS